MRDALLGLASERTTRLRILAAYVTHGGCSLILPALAAAVGARWRDIPKAIVTSFDFGITEPDALVYLLEAGFDVRIANLGAEDSVVIFPVGSAFHPKAYVFDEDDARSALVGSANLTRRALTVNVEAGYLGRDLGALDGVEAHWSLAVDTSVPLTEPILQDYREKRPAALRTPRSPEEPAPPPLPLRRTGSRHSSMRSPFTDSTPGRLPASGFRRLLERRCSQPARVAARWMHLLWLRDPRLRLRSAGHRRVRDRRARRAFR